MVLYITACVRSIDLAFKDDGGFIAKYTAAKW